MVFEAEKRLIQTGTPSLTRSVAPQFPILTPSGVRPLPGRSQQPTPMPSPPVLHHEAVLNRLLLGLHQSLDEADILGRLAQSLTQELNLQGCIIGLYQADLGMIDLHYRSGDIPPDWQMGQVRQEDWTVPLQQMVQGQPCQFCQAHPSERTTVFIYPFQLPPLVLGGMVLFSHRREGFSPADGHLIERIGEQCAIALNQARLYQAARFQVIELEKLNQLKDEFLSTISHELRTPMANMKMAIQMLGITWKSTCQTEEGKLQVQAEKVERYLQILHRECDRESRLINDLLDLQQLDTDTVSLVKSAIRLQEWLPYIVHPFRKRFQERQQTFHLEVAPNLPSLMCDQISLSRILVELLTNAHKYTPAQEKITLKVKQVPSGKGKKRSTCSPIAAKVAITISNTGIELPADELSRIFDKFYRVPQLDPWKQSGTGLGLALVKRLVQRLDGEIWAESSRKKTCLILHLPFGQTEDSQAS